MFYSLFLMRSKRLQSISIHEQLISTLRREILTKYKPGDRLDSINKLAKRHSISPLTLRITLVALSEEGLVDRRPGSGCYVTDPRQVKPVGILLGHDIFKGHTSIFYLLVTGYVRKYFEDRGWRVRLYIGHSTPNEGPQAPDSVEFYEDVAANRLSGVAAVLANPEPKWLNQLQQKDIPVVGLDFVERGESHGYPYAVTLDYDRLLPTATRYLLEQGRRRIAFLNWSQGGNTSWLEPAVTVLAEYGVTPRDGWVRGNLHPGQIGAGWEMFREIWSAYDEKPDGIVIADDLLFSEAKAAILELKIRVPEDLLIVSHANKDINLASPFPVARMEYDPSAVAHALSEMLARVMSKEPVPSHQMAIKSTLVLPAPPPGLANTVHAG